MGITKILFIAFEFPPLASAGVYRPVGFVKHLGEYGIEPVILTTDAQSFRQGVDAMLDESLVSELPADLNIERIRCPSTPEGRTSFQRWVSIFFSLTDSHATRWREGVIKEVERIVAEHRPKAIYVTAPPFSMARLGIELGRTLQLPLVLDLRDAWTQWRIAPYPTWFHYLLTHRLEEKTISSASRVICTSDDTRRDLLRIHPQIPKEKLIVVTNGYDEEVQDWQLPHQADGIRDFTIGYVGAFYYFPAAHKAMFLPWWKKRINRMLHYSPRKENWLYRSPYFFFAAVSEMLKQYGETIGRVRIRFAGKRPSWIDDQLAEFGLHDIVEFVGPLNRREVLRFQEACDALLVTSAKVIGGRDYSIAGKTFEYFARKKPIIGFVTEGAQKDILEKSGMAVICDPDQVQESAQKLRDLISGRSRFSPNAEFLNSLSRRNLTAKFARVLREAIAAFDSRGYYD